MENPTSLSKLESQFGSCELIVLGYNDRDVTPDNSWDWCAAVLPRDNMTDFLNARRQARGRRNFLFALASSGNLRGQDGVKHALYGIALAGDMCRPAQELLHPYQLEQEANQDENGRFKFPNGVPILRLWRPLTPTPFATLLGRAVSFNRSMGARGLRTDNPMFGDLMKAVLEVPLWEAKLHRRRPVPDVILRELQRVGAPDRDTYSHGDAPILLAPSERPISELLAGAEEPILPQTEHAYAGTFPKLMELSAPMQEVIISSHKRETFQRLAPEQRERAYRDYEAKRINGLVEIPSGSGFCDILTDDEVVEVKSYRYWRHALGQVLAYSHFHSGRRRRVHLFEVSSGNLEEALSICLKFDVALSYIR